MKLLFKIVIGIVVTIILILGVTYLLISIPKTVDTKWTEKDYENVIKKVGINLANADEEKRVGVADLLDGAFVDTDPKQLDNINVTAPEIAAFVNKSVKSDVISNFNIAFTDDSMIMTFKIGSDVASLTSTLPEVKPYEKYIKMAVGKPIYWELTAEKSSDKSFVSTTREIYVGQLKLPSNEAIGGLRDLGSSANNVISNFDNFKVDKFDISKKGFNFTGTIPTVINPR